MRSMIVSICSTIVLVAVGLGPQTKGGAPVIEKEVIELMQNLDRLDEPARMKLLADVDRQRTDLLGALLRQLGTSTSPEVQAAAIFLIGRHHLVGGVPELLRRIDFAPPKPRISEPEPLWETYPAMEALINIGQPAIPGGILLLATDNNDRRRSLALKVIRYVMQDTETARFILRRAEAVEKDPARKAMLQKAIGEFETAFGSP
jgi:hypothetical protein